jgi:hypothetical protein
MRDFTVGLPGCAFRAIVIAWPGLAPLPPPMIAAGDAVWCGSQ